MNPNWSALSTPEQLSLTKRELVAHPDLITFLQNNRSPLGDALLGDSKEAWNKRDVAAFESLILKRAKNKTQIARFLAIARNAAHLWSVHWEKDVPLPRFYFRPRHDGESPLGPDYAQTVTQYRSWCHLLSTWVHTLFSSASPEIENRPLLLAALFTSAMVHGGAFGTRFLGAIVRAMEGKRRTTFAVGDRVHIELSLSWYGVEEAEMRLWIPDPLTATLWNWVEPMDVDSLLDLVTTERIERPPNDIEILRRLGKLIREASGGRQVPGLGGILQLQRCCRIVAHTKLSPVLAHYCDCEITSNSLGRRHLRRLFPAGELVWLDPPAVAPIASQSLSASESAHSSESREWIEGLLLAAKSKPAHSALGKFVKTQKTGSLGHRLASFGISLLSARLYSGKSIKARQLPTVLEQLATSLAPQIGNKDIAEMDMSSFKNAVVLAILKQPIRERRSLIGWVLELDLYLRACIRKREPIPKSELPWPPDGISTVDVNLVTHEEFTELLRRIGSFWDARDGEQRRNMMRLIVALSFRCGLRRSEIRGLRIGGCLTRGVPELLIWPRKGEPRKSQRARRRVAIGALLSQDELRELCRWRDARIRERGKPDHYLFALPQENLKKIPNSLFEKLNSFLRSQSQWDSNVGGEIHLHTLRHAYSGYLFAALTLSQTALPVTLFPDLEETKAWLSGGRRLIESLYGHRRITGRHPALVAASSAHADFRTTAQSYIHLFPWLVSALLDATVDMRPDANLIKLATKEESNYRRWLNEGGTCGVPVRHLKHRYKDNHVEREDTAPREVLPFPKAPSTWAEREWDRLLRACHKLGSDDLPDLALSKMIQRAELLRDLTRDKQRPRHLMEIQNGKSRSNAVNRLACPSKPMTKANEIPSRLCARIENLYTEKTALVRDATEIFVHHLEEREWVRFNSLHDVAKANKYVEFLLSLDLRVRQIDLVCGDPRGDSPLRDKWKLLLEQRGLVIRHDNGSRNFGPKTALSIRPVAGSAGQVGSGHAAFRFVMTMAYVCFGAELEAPLSTSTP